MGNSFKLLGGILVFLMGFLPQNVLILSNSNGVLLYKPTITQHEVSMKWLHSVEKEEWEETYSVTEDELVLKSTRFKTFGAGVPDQTEKEMLVQDGWVLLEDMYVSMGKVIHFRTGKETQHVMTIKQCDFFLLPQESYQLEVKHVAIYKMLYQYFNHLREVKGIEEVKSCGRT
ncbi:DUF1850 domain-containing protein [Bacillus kexueae]|uniref:DUF1850 domain-containing protein n=1 Tax=Aeribacillus kexueae TaxID=2078952 RepID=UPI001FAFCB93|nr:DUF1850 domain-containing protein [Bacillus kexueae]